MWVIPIRMDAVEIHIHADRRLAFQVLTAFGSAQPNGNSSRVLRDEGPRKLVEFHSLIPSAAGGEKVYRTVEWVTLHEPEAIDFEGAHLVPGADRGLTNFPLTRDSGSRRPPIRFP
ncbi:MAG: hypothetical protein WAP47_05170 [Candidatus Rokuibacteriota bacterium]